MAAYIRYITYSRGELSSCRPCTLRGRRKMRGEERKKKEGERRCRDAEEKEKRDNICIYITG